MGKVEYYYYSGCELTREEYVEEMLKKVGKALFVKYYYEFKRQDSSNIGIITENYSDDSKRRRTGCAVSLFRQGLSDSALLNIANSKRLDESVRSIAKCIYSCEFDKVMI